MAVDIPSGFGPAGRRLWKSTLAEFELTVHERELLGSACRTLDVCERLQAVVYADGVIVDGKPHQVLVELRQQTILFARLVTALRLPTGLDEVKPHDPGPMKRRAPQRRSLRGVYQIAPSS